jgi:hypothetical protein
MSGEWVVGVGVVHVLLCEGRDGRRVVMGGFATLDLDLVDVLPPFAMRETWR